ncbi:MAG: class A beta-lactamase-related serine hydrolase [Candidatus Aminicenantes bacterium]|nr:class A beta-lactamase-related serine hydrolase [Candidatus Aminicenantes bacterium]
MKAKRVLMGAVVLAVTAVIAAGGLAQEPAATSRIERLKTQIERVIRGRGGHVGVAVKHIESGESLAVNGDMLFPLASAFKVPILVELLYQVQEGRFSLDDEIIVEKSDQHLGSGMISNLAAPGLKLSVLNMAHFMMMISDNSATDILLGKVGAANVNARLKSLGIEGMSVNRTCQKLISDFLALRSPARTPEEMKAAIVKFGENPEDSSTPLAMNTFLEKITKKEILNPDYCDLVLAIMRKCETGEKRIKGELPPRTIVAHKTGTIAGTVNDCGILFLPDGAGRVVLTVLSKDFTADTADVEAIIAKIARFVYDYFYFTK